MPPDLKYTHLASMYACIHKNTATQTHLTNIYTYLAPEGVTEYGQFCMAVEKNTK